MHQPAPRAILAVVAFGVFIAADDLTVVSTMLRPIIFDLGIPLPEGLNDAAWIVNAYLIAYVVVMPFAGRLSDLAGRRAVFMGALLLFLAGSLWLPLATTLPAFLAGRVLTALGGGAMVPVGMAVLADVYPPGRRATALGTLGAVDTAGWVWGPLYGALLVRFLSWRWQFYLNVPLSLLGLAVAWWALRDLPRPAARRRIDWVGTAVLSIALLSLNVALLNSSGNIQGVASLTELAGNQPGSDRPLYLLAGLALAAFVGWQRRLARTGGAPLIDLALFRQRNFSVAVLVNFLVGAVLVIAMVNVPLLVNVLELDIGTAALTSGYLLSGMTGAMALLAYAGGRLTERLGYRLVTAVGLALCTVAFGVMGASWMVGTSYLQMALPLVILGAGFGLVTAPVGTAVINAAPDDQRGIAASLVIVLRLIGMSVGLSALTAWGLDRFERLRTQVVLPDLPFTDPAYQQAIIAGLTRLTVTILTETFLVSAVVAAAALLVSLALRRGDRPVG